MIALVGPPNSGKTTLFNWLTGSQYRAVNYPGATVECLAGEAHKRYGHLVSVLDTPGTYSLFAKSLDEQVTVETLFENRRNANVEKLIVVVDATQWRRQFPLVEQIKQSGYPFVLALTMSDMLESENVKLDFTKLGQKLGVEVVMINGKLGGGVQELLDRLDQYPKADSSISCPEIWNDKDYQKSLNHADSLANEFVKAPTDLPERKYVQLTKSWDQWLLHPVFGLIIFFGVMATLFSSLFYLADPLMGMVDQSFAFVADQILALTNESLFGSFLANGIVASFGAVLVFVPQIFILFLGIHVLEDSGYLARAATLIDSPFSKVGMSGRSFVPLLSGYACAVPAMMATRNIRSPMERLIALFVIPLMTCSARLPVYALLLSFVFFGQEAWKPGLVLAALYFGSLVVGAIAAGIVHRLIPQGGESQTFLMELPFYRRPSLKVVVRTALTRTWSYIRRAGPIIFTLALVIWVLSTFPQSPEASETVQLQNSFLGQGGQWIEPAFEPMGSDWRVGIALLSAFAAREVFVSTLAVVFQIAGGDEGITDSLIAKMQNATWEDGSPLFTSASVAALLVFFMIALQCLSTFAMAVKEVKSYKFAVIQLVTFNLVAYLLAVITFQVLA